MEPSRTGLTTPIELAALKRDLAAAVELKSIAKEKRIFALKIILKIILCLLIVTAFSFLLMLSLAKKDGSSPVVFGFGISIIKNDRMVPSLRTGSVVITQNIKAFKEGDAVIYTNAAGTSSAARITQKNQSKDQTVYTANFDNYESFPDSVAIDGNKIKSVILIVIPYFMLY